MLRLKCVLWRGAKETATFYRFQRVRLALHVTAKGIYILGFCTLTFIYTYIHTYIHSFIHSHNNLFLYISYHFILLAYFNRLLLHLIIVYPLLVYMLSIALCLYMRLLLVLLLGFLVSFLQGFFWLRSAPLHYPLLYSLYCTSFYRRQITYYKL